MKAPGTEHTGSGPFSCLELTQAQIITNQDGRFRMANVYLRGSAVYGMLQDTKNNGRVFALKSDGKTTIDNLKWDEIIGLEVEFSSLGRMVVKS